MQPELFHDSITDAIGEAVRAAGGAKTVAAMLWPHEGVDAAQRKLLDALNPDRPHKLAPVELVAIARAAHAKGGDSIVTYLCAELGYSAPVRVAPLSQAALLLQQCQARMAELPALMVAMTKLAAQMEAK